MAPASRVRLKRFLPQVMLATLLVVVAPSLVGWTLRTTGVIASEPVVIALVVALSLAAAYLGGQYWKTRSGSGDLLFSELMLWGWLRRWWKERRLASVLVLAGGVASASADGRLDRERRAQLLVDLADALEARDPYTHGHSHRVARHAEMIASEMGLSEHDAAKIRTAAALHDVGKINTPVAILHKSGRLTEAEFEVIQRHSADGADMVATLGDPELEAMVRDHHERIDGSGYPGGRVGESICLGARIIAVADTFDAITSSRPYRSAKTHREALQILASESGVRLDRDAVAAFQGYYWGRRPLAVWVGMTNLLGRTVSSLGGSVNVTAAAMGRVIAASALTGASAAAISVPLLAAARAPDRQDTTPLPATPATLTLAADPLSRAAPTAGGSVAPGGTASSRPGQAGRSTSRRGAGAIPGAQVALAFLPGSARALLPGGATTAATPTGVVVLSPGSGSGATSSSSPTTGGQAGSGNATPSGGNGSPSPSLTTPAAGGTPTGGGSQSDSSGGSGGGPQGGGPGSGKGQGDGSGAGQGGGGHGSGGGSGGDSGGGGGGSGGPGGQGQGQGNGGGSGGGAGSGGPGGPGGGGGSGAGGPGGGGSGDGGGSGGQGQGGGQGSGGGSSSGGGGSGGQGQDGGQGNGGGGGNGGGNGNGNGGGKGHAVHG